jgi:hypothetical protein
VPMSYFCAYLGCTRISCGPSDGVGWRLCQAGRPSPVQIHPHLCTSNQIPQQIEIQV